MGEIVRQWLSQRLGILLDRHLDSLPEMAQDGILFGDILHNYGVITYGNLSRLVKTFDFDQAYRNLVYLQTYLKEIGVNCNDKCLRDIANKKPTAALMLLYQMYVLFNSKNKLTYTMEKSIKSVPCKPPEKFNERPYNACQVNELSVSQCKEIRETYAKKLQAKLDKQIQATKEIKEDYQLVTAEQKVHVPKYDINKPDTSITVNDQGDCIPDTKKAKQYISYLKQKQHKYNQNKIIQRQMNKLLLNELLGKLIEKEDVEYKQMMTDKLLRQSCYEKHMTEKLMEVRHQKEIILENLRNQHIELNKQREQEYVEKLFQRDLNLTNEERRFIENRKRQLELHKKLWDEKKKREHKENYLECEKITYGLVDLSIKSVEYRKQYGMEMPKSNWHECVSLFLAEQPIFNVDTIVDVVDDIESMPEPLTIELYRQERLDEEYFSDYTNIYGQWDLDLAVQFYEENSESISLGLNVLGFVVHRLLQIKYPWPEKVPKFELPESEVRACIVGLDTRELLPILQRALANASVSLIEMQTVINYFLTAYHEENLPDVDEVLSVETHKVKKKDKKKKKDSDKGSKKSKKSKKGEKERKEKEIPIELVPKETQTPRLFPGEEKTIPRKAELGKFAYETLNLGLEINDHLITAMLLEYLKQLTFVKGWILINFPESINEAYLLEELLNGEEIPDSFLVNTENIKLGTDFEDRVDIFKSPSDPYINIRQSKLVPNPKPIGKQKYESFFTVFVHMCYESNENQIELTDLVNFYEKLQIYNRFTYSKVDLELIRDLIKFITKDERFANKIYEELIKNAVENVKTEDTTEKPQKEKKGKKGKKEKAKKEKVKKEKKSKKEPVKEEIKVPSLPKIVEVPKVEEVIKEPPKPGEKEWEYVLLPIPKEYGKILATMWQDLENIYTNDFKELLFSKRIYQNAFVPYANDISIHMREFIERPDQKQDYVHTFQKTYNDIANDLREDDEFKAELHFQLSEFRDRLWGICDTRMKESEEERQKIIKESWFSNHGISVSDVFVKATQLELDRCINTLQIIQDYYTFMSLSKPSENKLPKTVLNKFSTSNESKLDKIFEKMTNIFIDIEKNVEKNEFVLFLNTVNENALSYINTLLKATVNCVKLVETAFKPKGKIKPKKKHKEVTLTENDIALSQNIEKIIAEWNCAIDAEVLRTKFRLKLIMEKAHESINESLNVGEKLFHEIYEQIQERYNAEVESVDAMCQIFARAIEACEPVQIRFILDGAEFRTDPNTLFYPDEPPIYDTIKERVTDVEFSVAQLSNLTDIFLDIAPKGYMPQNSFVYLLQDMITVDSEGTCERLLPEYWYKLRLEDVSKVSENLYGKGQFVDWRDFIIWNLLLPYPTEHELLELRWQFRQMDPDKLEYVNTQQFFAVNFWFEEEFSDDQDLYRVNLIKELLCKMFKIDKDQVNYTGLLLYFCKDVDSLRGVSKAFELAVGNLVCWDCDVGVSFIAMLRKQRALEEERKQQVYSTAASILGHIVDKTMDFVDSDISLHDVTEEESSIEETLSYLCEEEEMGIPPPGLPSLCYFLSYSTLIKVMTAIFPWNFTVENSFQMELEAVFQSCYSEEFEKVFMHEFLNSERFMELINRTSKFVERIPSDVVRSFVDVCICEKKQQIL